MTLSTLLQARKTLVPYIPVHSKTLPLCGATKKVYRIPTREMLPHAHHEQFWCRTGSGSGIFFALEAVPSCRDWVYLPVTIHTMSSSATEAFHPKKVKVAEYNITSKGET